MVRFRDSLLLMTIGLYIILNHGFMLVRVPPVASGGVPVGEIVLLFSLATINFSSVLPRLSSTVFLLPFFIWWIYGLSRALIGVPAHGLWSLRDASHVIESLFIFVGFVYAGRPSSQERLWRWLPVFLVISCLYVFTYPVSKYLRPYSPTIIAGAGYVAHVFFNYITGGVICILASLYLLLFKERLGISTKTTTAFIALLLGYTMLVFHSRTFYLQLIAIVVFITAFKKEYAYKLLWGIGFVIVLLVMITVLGLRIKGRMGNTVTIGFIYHHFLAIFGVSSEGLEGSAGGVFQRLGWWYLLYKRWTASLVSFLFGLGYGFPLIDFGLVHEVSAREPHNSGISIIARLGIIGAAAFVWMHILLLKAWHKALSLCKSIGWRDGEHRLLFVMAYFILIWVLSIGEDAFEKPFNAIPYFFLWGTVLRFLRHMTLATIVHEGISGLNQ